MGNITTDLTENKIKKLWKSFDLMTWTNSWKDTNYWNWINLNRPTTSKGIELLIQNFLTKKIPGQDGLIGHFYQMFKELTPIFHKVFKKEKKRKGI